MLKSHSYRREWPFKSMFYLHWLFVDELKPDVRLEISLSRPRFLKHCFMRTAKHHGELSRWLDLRKLTIWRMEWADVYERRLLTDVEENGFYLDRLTEI